MGERANRILSFADFRTDGLGSLRSPSGIEWLQV
jgi:hypothetical protein